MKLILSLLVACSLSMFAQGNRNKQEKREQIKALKVSFLTTELKLSSDESEKFWPVYNAYEEKQYKIRHDKMRPLIRKIDEVGIDKMSEKEALSYLDQLENADEELFNLRKKLVTDLKPIIGPARILKLKKAEDDFNKKLLHKYRGKKKG